MVGGSDRLFPANVQVVGCDDASCVTMALENFTGNAPHQQADSPKTWPEKEMYVPTTQHADTGKIEASSMSSWSNVSKKIRHTNVACEEQKAVTISDMMQFKKCDTNIGKVLSVWLSFPSCTFMDSLELPARNAAHAVLPAAARPQFRCCVSSTL